MLGGILLLAIIAIAFAVMLGFTGWAKKAFFWVIVVAAFGPCLFAAVREGLANASLPAWPFLFAILVLILWAYLRFRRHRRKLGEIWGEQKTSLKKRVDRD